MAVLGRVRRRGVKKTEDLFRRSPFSAILFAGFTPDPFFPVRLLVVITGCSLPRYLMGVLLSRPPRFLLLAAFGSLVPIPGKLPLRSTPSALGPR
jgi:uncharacterized membrane protein YdjX (TVP38/TMEM64 family)